MEKYGTPQSRGEARKKLMWYFDKFIYDCAVDRIDCDTCPLEQQVVDLGDLVPDTKYGLEIPICELFRIIAARKDGAGKPAEPKTCEGCHWLVDGLCISLKDCTSRGRIRGVFQLLEGMSDDEIANLVQWIAENKGSENAPWKGLEQISGQTLDLQGPEPKVIPEKRWAGQVPVIRPDPIFKPAEYTVISHDGKGDDQEMDVYRTREALVYALKNDFEGQLVRAIFHGWTDVTGEFSEYIEM